MYTGFYFGEAGCLANANCCDPTPIITKYACKCITTQQCPTGQGHKHACEARTDGTGYMDTLQECLDMCPCEVTNIKTGKGNILDNTQVVYDAKKLDSCPGHTIGNYNVVPLNCMIIENTTKGGLG